MNEVNEASPASETSDVERVVMCADPICGNCGKRLSEHDVECYRGERTVYCYKHTNGDLFTDTPQDSVIFDMILADNPDMYDDYLARWQRENGHI